MMLGRKRKNSFFIATAKSWPLLLGSSIHALELGSASLIIFVCVVIAILPPSFYPESLSEKSLSGMPTVSIISWMSIVRMGIIGDYHRHKQQI